MFALPQPMRHRQTFVANHEEGQDTRCGRMWSPYADGSSCSIPVLQRGSMLRRLAIVSLSQLVILSAGCDQPRSTVTGPDIAFRAQRAATEQTVPFRTSSYLFQAIAAVPEPGCNAPGESRRYLSGEGAATHLGRYTVDLSFCARVGGVLDDGRGAFVAASGDVLQLTFEGTSTFVPPFTLSFTSFATFTGGSGRFVGASGEAVVTGTLDVRTGAGDGRWDGTIASVGWSKR